MSLHVHRIICTLNGNDTRNKDYVSSDTIIVMHQDWGLPNCLGHLVIRTVYCIAALHVSV